MLSPFKLCFLLFLLLAEGSVSLAQTTTRHERRDSDGAVQIAVKFKEAWRQRDWDAVARVMNSEQPHAYPDWLREMKPASDAPLRLVSHTRRAWLNIVPPTEEQRAMVVADSRPRLRMVEQAEGIWKLDAVTIWDLGVSDGSDHAELVNIEEIDPKLLLAVKQVWQGYHSVDKVIDKGWFEQQTFNVPGSLLYGGINVATADVFLETLSAWDNVQPIQPLVGPARNGITYAFHLKEEFSFVIDEDPLHPNFPTIMTISYGRGEPVWSFSHDIAVQVYEPSTPIVLHQHSQHDEEVRALLQQLFEIRDINATCTRLIELAETEGVQLPVDLIVQSLRSRTHSRPLDGLGPLCRLLTAIGPDAESALPFLINGYAIQRWATNRDKGTNNPGMFDGDFSLAMFAISGNDDNLLQLLRQVDKFDLWWRMPGLISTLRRTQPIGKRGPTDTLRLLKNGQWQATLGPDALKQLMSKPRSSRKRIGELLDAIVLCGPTNLNKDETFEPVEIGFELRDMALLANVDLLRQSAKPIDDHLLWLAKHRGIAENVQLAIVDLIASRRPELLSHVSELERWAIEDARRLLDSAGK